jgi:hypothetical protein
MRPRHRLLPRTLPSPRHGDTHKNTANWLTTQAKRKETQRRRKKPKPTHKRKYRKSTNTSSNALSRESWPGQRWKCRRAHEKGVFEGNDGLGFGRGNTRVFSKFVAFKLHQWEQFTRIRWVLIRVVWCFWSNGWKLRIDGPDGWSAWVWMSSGSLLCTQGKGMYKFLTFEVALKVRAAPFFSFFWCVCAKCCAIGIFLIYIYSVEMFFLFWKTIRQKWRYFELVLYRRRV